jgi:hypothetical protein
MDQIFALVDYDNQRVGRFRGIRPGGLSLNFRDHEDFIGSLVNQLLDYREKQSHRTDGLVELHIRLYGGWTDLLGESTQLADMVSKAIRLHGYSYRVRDTRILLALADRPLSAASEPLLGTLRPVPWQLSISAVSNHPNGCTNIGPNCPHIQGALSWSTGRCPAHPGCTAVRDDTFISMGQKMVDTMIVSDAIFVRELGASEVIVASADDDVVPGLLTVAALGIGATLIRFGMRRPGRFDGMLHRSRVGVIDFPEIS